MFLFIIKLVVGLLLYGAIARAVAEVIYRLDTSVDPGAIAILALAFPILVMVSPIFLGAWLMSHGLRRVGIAMWSLLVVMLVGCAHIEPMPCEAYAEDPRLCLDAAERDAVDWMRDDTH